MSPAQRTYPVVVLRAGLAAQSLEYSALAEDLASHGYIVVGIDAPYRTGVVVFPDGRVVTKLLANDPENVSEEEGERIASRLVSEWRADIGFALDQLEQSNEADPLKVFTERLDLTRVGVLGHSLGGATAAQFCLDDPRCKVGIDIDGSLLGTVLKSAPAKPFMFLMGDHSKELDPADRQIDANINAVYNRLPAQSRVLLYIRGANHFNFSDGAIVKSHLVMSVLRIFGVVGLDGQRQLVVTSHCVHTFLDRNLRGDTSVAVLTVSPLYPELQAHL